MTAFTEDDLAKLSKLCKIPLSKEEGALVSSNLNQILGYMQRLTDLDLTGFVPPVPDDTPSVFAEDEVSELLDRDVFLNNAPTVDGKPCHINGMIKVPAVIRSGGVSEELA